MFWYKRHMLKEAPCTLPMSTLAKRILTVSCSERCYFFFQPILYSSYRALDTIPRVYSHAFTRKPPAPCLDGYPIIPRPLSPRL